MHTRRALAPLVLSVGAVLLAGCSAHAGSDPAPASGTVSQAPPTLGGRPPATHAPPDRPMGPLAKPVYDRLAAQVARQGLTLTYLDCPHWDGVVPARMTCWGYVDGLVARVGVHLRAAVEGKAVGFDARLLDGVIATRKLEDTLRRQGWTHVGCGDVPAYPARVGSRIVCHVQRAGDDRYVVATVSDRAGAVMIGDYHGATPAS